MPDIIHLLPDSIANQIAAGEVIQRPASAVKELLENAIDAGSSSIQLIIKDAGKSLIQVIDDGCGMSDTDARLCFERHATSKISSIDDLFAIRTKGFRGEALASIAAVAQVELKSRKVEDELGTAIMIEGSEVKSQEPCQQNPGTSFSIKNLFYNVPARRNFLKSNPVETRHIVEEFQRVALAHPDVFFSFHNNDLQIFHLKAGNLRQRITGIFGNNYNERIVPVQEQTDLLKIFGFVGKPENARKTRGEQYFFVNNRFIKNPYLNHAVFNNYDDLIPSGTYPFFVLFLDIDAAKIDINVHPTKQEIKFEDERAIYGIVRAAIKHALGKYSVTPSLDFEQEASMNLIQTQYYKGQASSKPMETVPGAFVSGSREFQKERVKNWEKLFEVTLERDDETTTANHETMLDMESDHGMAGREKTPNQIHNKYILSPIKSGFILIDQQAAHERVLFEKYLNALNSNTRGSQKQLFPQTYNCSKDDAVLLKDILPEVNALGFDVQEFGDNTFVIHGIPSDIDGGEQQDMLEELLENYKMNFSVLKLGKRESLARSLAQKASIQAGQPLGTKEMQLLIDELFACEQPYVAPGKKLTFITFDFNDLEKRFAQQQ